MDGHGQSVRMASMASMAYKPPQEGDPSEVECHHGETPLRGAIFRAVQDLEKDWTYGLSSGIY